MHSLLLLVDSGLITGTRTCWWVTNAGSRSTGMCLTGAKLADWLFLIVIWTSERTPCSTTAMVVGHQNNGWLNKLSLSLKLWHWISFGVRNNFPFFNNCFPRWWSCVWAVLHQKSTLQCSWVPATPQWRGFPWNPWFFGGQEMECCDMDAGLNFSAGEHLWFCFQDGATVHTERHVMEFLDRRFGRRVLSARCVNFCMWPGLTLLLKGASVELTGPPTRQTWHRPTSSFMALSSKSSTPLHPPPCIS